MQRLGKHMPAVLMAVTLVALASAQVVHAAAPPWPGCRPASKVEYDSAKRQYLLTNRFGEYVRAGRMWRRSYWYCPR